MRSPSEPWGVDDLVIQVGFSAGRSVAYRTVFQQFFAVIRADNSEGVFKQTQSFQGLNRWFDLPVQQLQLACYL